MPIYLHGDDRAFVTRPHPSIVPWYGESCRLSDDILLLRTGGHFAGGTVLHWRAAAEGRGALFTGDVAMVAMDRRSVSFMYSYPNYIPLNAAGRSPHRRDRRAAGVRSHLRRLVGPQYRQRRQGGLQRLGAALYRRDFTRGLLIGWNAALARNAALRAASAAAVDQQTIGMRL